jgi:hypothetical protein
MIPKTLDEREALAAILRFEERVRLDTGVDDVRLLVGSRLDLPHAFHRRITPLRETDRRLCRLGPRGPEIV